MSKIINILKNNSMPQSSLIPEEAKTLDLALNHAKLCLLDGGRKVRFSAAIRETSYGPIYVVLVQDCETGEELGQLESPMAIVIAPGVYSLPDGSEFGIRVVCHDPELRREICA